MNDLEKILNVFYENGGKIMRSGPNEYVCTFNYIFYRPGEMGDYGLKSSYWQFRKYVKENGTCLSKKFSTRRYGFDNALALALQAKMDAGYEMFD